MYTLREFVEASFARVGVPVEWRGSGVDEVGVDATGVLGEPGRVLVQVDPRYFRPTEVELLLGDPSKARDELGWQPKVKFRELVEMMAYADVADQTREKYLQDEGLVATPLRGRRCSAMHPGYEVKNYFE